MFATRRVFLLTSVGLAAAAVAAETGWADRVLAVGSTIQVAPGTVKIVEFSDAGKRLGVASLAKVVKTDAEWLHQLTPIEFAVTRQQDTEQPYTGPLNDFYKPGLYRCICCNNALYSSETKYDAHEGWPSFWAPLAAQNLLLKTDTSFGMVRTEVRCTLCEAHLGHRFDDGPPPTGERYCMDSAALRFVPLAKG